MYKGYLLSSILALGLYGYAQLKGWTLAPSPAQEFQRMRAEQQEYQRSGGSSGSSGRSSGGFSGK
jgi:uncharacterized membrane protein YgcG